MLSAAMGGSARLSQPDVRSPLYTNPETREEGRTQLACAPFSSIAAEDIETPALKRAPIASLECMEEVPTDIPPVTSDSNLLSLSPPPIKYKPLGKSGLRVSQLGLGTWVTLSPQVNEEIAEEVITLAYECGINVFDISEAYSGGRAEVLLGQILKKKAWRRSSYHVLTKVYWNSKGDEKGLSRKHIIESVKASLQRLQLDYIDVIIIHKSDDMCPMEEVVRAASHVIDQGLSMYWGTSRWTAVEIMEAWTNCRQFNCITPIVEQSEYHLFCRGKTELYLPEMYNKIGVGTMAWSPLALGLINSKMEEGGIPVFTRQSFKRRHTSPLTWSEEETQQHSATAKEQGFTWVKEKEKGSEEGRKQELRLRELCNLARKLNCTLTQLSLAWAIRNENLHCILVGATSTRQLLEHLDSLKIVSRLKQEHINELERILGNKPIRPPMISTLAQR